MREESVMTGEFSVKITVGKSSIFTAMKALTC